MMKPKENLLRVIRHDRPEHVPCADEGTFREVRFAAIEWPEEPGTDVWGTSWEKGNSAVDIYPYPVTHPLESLEKLDDFPFPDFSQAPLSEDSKRHLADPERAERILVGLCGETIFERSWMLRGMDNFMVDLLESPELAGRLVRKVSSVRKTQVRRLIEAGVDMMLFCDDWGGQTNMLISPEIWRRFIKPEIAELYRMCREAGVLIKQHSCGSIEAILGDLVEIGADIWDPCQPTSNDLAGLKKKYGDRITFWGAINSYILDRGTPDEVRAEVRLRIAQLAEGGGYIATPSHIVPFKKENIEAMKDEIARVGQYGSPAFKRLFQ